MTYCIFRDQTYRVITWQVPNPHWPRNSKVTTTAFACLEGLPDILGKAIGATEAIAKLGYELDRIERTRT